MAVTAEKITRARCSQQPLTRHHTPAEWVTTTTTHPPPHTSRVGDKATYFSITRLSAACASFVMASASSRITSLTPLVNTLRVDANVLIVSRTTSILRQRHDRQRHDRQRHDRHTSKASATQQVNNAPHVFLLAGSVKGGEAVSCAIIGFVVLEQQQRGRKGMPNGNGQRRRWSEMVVPACVRRVELQCHLSIVLLVHLLCNRLVTPMWSQGRGQGGAEVAVSTSDAQREHHTLTVAAM
jgi:hypothetical protein